MVDTLIGNFEEKCSDCGIVGSVIKHWGYLVPKLGFFCSFCWFMRINYYQEMVPLGVKPPGMPKRLKGKEVVVVTKNSKYSILPTKKENGNIILSKRWQNSKSFNVLLLEQGHPFCFRNRNEDWVTSPVQEILIV